MAINKKIIEKFKDKVGEKSNEYKALLALILFEDDTPGNYKSQYIRVLENSIKEFKEDED